jgi:hypothetical protein
VIRSVRGYLTGAWGLFITTGAAQRHYPPMQLQQGPTFTTVHHRESKYRISCCAVPGSTVRFLALNYSKAAPSPKIGQKSQHRPQVQKHVNGPCAQTMGS